ncbi:MAG: amidohydrolase family protein [Chloroflexi bacterium]|nr:amidohydrolase family protein [Chloroflexota bacterium]
MNVRSLERGNNQQDMPFEHEIEVIYRAAVVVPIATEPIQDGGVVTNGRRILAIGPLDQCKASFPRAKLVDLGQRLLMPGLINTHTHLQLSHLAHLIPLPQPFVSWILSLIDARRNTPADSLASHVALELQTMRTRGVVAVGDICNSRTTLEVLHDSAVEGVVYYEVIGLDERLASELLKKAQERVEEWQALAGHRLRIGLSLHTPYTVSARLFELATEWARREGLPLCIHLAESADEVAFLRDGAGRIIADMFPRVNWQDLPWSPVSLSPVEYLARLGCLEASPLLVHGVQVTEADVDLIRQSGSTLAHCPRSNANLLVGRAPLETYLSMGVVAGLGTDGLCSVASLDLFEEMRFAQDLHGEAVSAQAIARMATQDGARALGLDKDLGTLEPGKRAQMIAIDLPPGALPADIYEFIVREGGRQQVTVISESR